MKKLISILFLTTLLYSCAGIDDLNPDKDQNLCAVSFTSSGMQANATRSSTFLPLGSPMDIAAFTVASDIVSDTHKALKNYTISNNVGTLTAANEQDMYLTRNNYRFYAWSPSKSLSEKALSITPNEDVKVTSKDAVLQGEDSITIDFPAMTRLCSYVDFRIYIDANNISIVKFNMGDEGIKLNGMTHSPIAYSLGQSAILLSGVALDDSCSIAGAGFTNTNDTLNTCGGALLPKMEAAFALKMAINANLNTPMLLKAPVPHIAFAPGYYYRFSIKINYNSILMAMQVVPWTTVVTNTTGGTASSGEVIGAVNWDALISQGYDLGNGAGGSVLVGSWNIRTWSTSGGTNPTGGLTGSDWVVNTHWSSDLGTTYGYYQLSTGTWVFTTATTQGGTAPTSGFVLEPWAVNLNWETVLGLGTGTGVTIGTWNYQTATSTTGGTTTAGSLTTQGWTNASNSTTDAGASNQTNGTVSSWNVKAATTTGGTTTTGTMTTQGWTNTVTGTTDMGGN